MSRKPLPANKRLASTKSERPSALGVAAAPAFVEKPTVEHRMKPTIILIGADKGGVGKTTLSRAVLDYLASNNILARAFDTETPRGTLLRFHPAETAVVDLTSAADQMKIVDTLETAEIKVSVIDVRAGGFITALQALQDMGFLEAVAEGEFNFIVFHVLGPSIASLREIEEIAPYVENAHYFLVKNHVNDTTFFDWDPQTHRKYFEKVNTAGEVTIPKLNELAYEQVEIAGTPYATFVANQDADGEPANHSFVLRGYVRTWTGRIADEFDRISLLGIISPRTSKPVKAGKER